MTGAARRGARFACSVTNVLAVAVTRYAPEPVLAHHSACDGQPMQLLKRDPAARGADELHERCRTVDTFVIETAESTFFSNVEVRAPQSPVLALH